MGTAPARVFSNVSAPVPTGSKRRRERFSTRSGYVKAYWMGSRMSGGLICAFTEPSTNSTIEWIMLWWWMTTSMFSHGTSNSQRASITSNALFISVAESTVIFGPMFQVGWSSASSGVTFARSSGARPRNAPPDAVMMRRDTRSGGSPRRHCQMAFGSLSTGSISAPLAFAAAASRPPAMTTPSLFASATFLPAPQRGQRRPHAHVADDGVDHEIDVLVADHVLDGALDAPAGQQGGLPPPPPRLGPFARDEPRAELVRLLGQHTKVPARRQGHDVEAVRIRPRHVQRLDADRPGRPQHGQPFH